MIILEQIKTRESIITFIKINDEIVIKKQFINTLSKESAHRLDFNKCPCKGPVKGLFDHEVKNLESICYCDHFPKIIHKNNSEMSYLMSYCGDSFNKMKKKYSKDKIKSLIPKNWEEQIKLISNTLDNENIYHNDICGNNICLKDNKIYLIDFVCTQPLNEKIQNNRTNYNDLHKFIKQYT